MSWAFAGLPFAVVSEGATEPEWFEARVERTVDAVAGASAPIIYVDIGATTYAPLKIVAQFTDDAARAALEALLGQSGTLADDDGRSCSARMVGAAPIRVKRRASGVYRLALEFERHT